MPTLKRSLAEILLDIQSTALLAREEGDLKTALKGYELEGKLLLLHREEGRKPTNQALTIHWQEEE